jgi:hypothetical protein
MITTNFFRHNVPPISENDALLITGEVIWHNGRLKSLDEINTNLPVQLSLASYMRLAATTVLWDKKNLVSMPNSIGVSLGNFLSRFKKGSKNFRKVLNGTKCRDCEKIQNNCIASFVRASIPVPVPVPVPVPAQLPVPELTIALIKESKFLALWNTHFLNNRMRDFLYKFTSNRLGIAARVAHFNANVNEGCTFCTLDRRFPAPRETMDHLFVQCPLVGKIHTDAARLFWPELQIAVNDPVFWLCGVTADRAANSTFLQIAVCVINYYVWECKLKKMVLGWESCKNFTIDCLKSYCKISNKFNEERINCSISLSRKC